MRSIDNDDETKHRKNMILYRPFVWKKHQPNFWLPITICFNVNTWNANFLVIPMRFWFLYTPYDDITHRPTTEKKLYTKRMKKKLFHFFRCWIVSCVHFPSFHKERRPICVIKPIFVCIAWIESIYLWWNFIYTEPKYNDKKLCIEWTRKRWIQFNVCEFVSIVHREKIANKKPTHTETDSLKCLTRSMISESGKYWNSTTCARAEELTELWKWYSRFWVCYFI